MCGIVGYIGHRDAYPIVLKGLQRLEYRGYDSAGMALFDGQSIRLTKTKGKVSDLEAKINVEHNTTAGQPMGFQTIQTHTLIIQILEIWC
jgi:glutamine---fructose-6-phosphate transaminase (isomerizing)